jgi:hypothetical protein
MHPAAVCFTPRALVAMPCHAMHTTPPYRTLPRAAGCTSPCTRRTHARCDAQLLSHPVPRLAGRGSRGQPAAALGGARALRPPSVRTARRGTRSGTPAALKLRVLHGILTGYPKGIPLPEKAHQTARSAERSAAQACARMTLRVVAGAGAARDGAARAEPAAAADGRRR